MVSAGSGATNTTDVLETPVTETVCVLELQPAAVSVIAVLTFVRRAVGIVPSADIISKLPLAFATFIVFVSEFTDTLFVAAICMALAAFALAAEPIATAP